MKTELAALLDLEIVDRVADSSAVTYRTTVTDTFTIGPKVHGGSLQTVVTHAARRALTDLADPDADPALIDGVTAIAVASDYLAAPDPAAVDVAVRIVKRGRTVSLAHVEVTQHGRVAVSSTVTLGRLDSGEPHHRGRGLLDDLPVDPIAGGLAMEGTPLGSVMHLSPALELILDPTSFPAATGQTGEPVIRGWTRPADLDLQPSWMNLDFPVLVCDLSPPVVMNLGLFGWAPTVQLTTYVRRVPADGWLRFAASSSEVGQGMFAEDHLVVDSTGATVAQSRQLALIPAAR